LIEPPVTWLVKEQAGSQFPSLVIDDGDDVDVRDLLKNQALESLQLSVIKAREREGIHLLGDLPNLEMQPEVDLASELVHRPCLAIRHFLCEPINADLNGAESKNAQWHQGHRDDQ
jgi:hypothetical protein